jgi:hypothetical protein
VVERSRVGDRALYTHIVGGLCWHGSLETRQGTLGKAEDRRFGRSGSVMWKDSTYKVIAPACVG